MDPKLLATLGARAVPTSATATLALALCSFITVRASLSDSPNSGMADPIALERAFDRFAGSDERNRLTLSLANLRGISGEAVNAGGSVTVDLASGAVTSIVRRLPADGVFDLWLIDNQPGPNHTALAEDVDVLLPFQRRRHRSDDVLSRVRRIPGPGRSSARRQHDRRDQRERDPARADAGAST